MIFKIPSPYILSSELSSASLRK